MADINTGGGSAIQGDARTQGGPFVGRDINNYGGDYVRDSIVDLKMRVEFIEQRERQRGTGPTWLQIANVIVAIIAIAGLIYFGRGLYELADQLRVGNAIQQRIEQQYQQR